ncbi:hypothetical protein X777_10226 [Ooceraea biroi]|uniref:Uncharacterized protein n=1 Tax=Ooceraea biroi TaxID=2015173 RepID=A0A026X3N6_OOCBI|nr:hypothetical protein X777_10226 [Ooceraea biroi]
MVCVPCFAVPVFLIIWRFLIQPLLTKWWQLRNKGEDTKENPSCPVPVKECKNGTCTLSWKDNRDVKKSDCKTE